MSGFSAPRANSRRVSRLDSAVYDLARNRPGLAGRTPGIPAVFSAPGPVTVMAAVSDPWEWDKGHLLYILVVRLRVAGTTNTVVQFRRNNVLFTPTSAITLASGVLRATLAVPSAFADYGGGGKDVLQMQITSAGAGASGLTAWGYTYGMG